METTELVRAIEGLTADIKGALAAATDPAAIETAVTKALAATTGSEPSLAQKALAEQSAAHQAESTKDAPYVWIKGLDPREEAGPELTQKALHLVHGCELESTGYRAEAAKNFKQAADEHLLVSLILKANWRQAQKPGEFDETKLGTYGRLQKVREQVEKSFSLTSGEPWIPQQFSDQLLPLIFIERQLPGLLTPIDMPSALYRLPLDMPLSILPYATEMGPAGADTKARVKAAAAGTGKSEMTAKGMSLRSVVDRLATESSIIAAMPTIQMQLARALTWGCEEVIVNGDTAAGGAGAQDSACPADCRILFDGLRKYAFGASSAFDIGGTGKFKPSVLGDLRSKLSGELKGDPSRLLFVFSPTADDIAIASSDWALFQATYATNEQLASAINGPNKLYFGTPKVTSIALRSDMTTGGKWTGSGATTGVLCLHRDCWALGRVGGPTGEIVRDAETDSYVLVVHQYIALKNLRPEYTSASFGYNLVA